MQSIRSIAAFVVFLGVLSALVLALGDTRPLKAQTSQAKPAAAFKPVQSIQDMMAGQGKLFTEIREGILDKQWKEAGKAAWILAEIGNVNQYQNDKPDYKGFAKQMSLRCAELAGALQREDEQAARRIVRQVGQACSTCHDKYKE